MSSERQPQITATVALAASGTATAVAGTTTVDSKTVTVTTSSNHGLTTGDVVVIGGESRLCYHGVPRVFTDEKVDGDVMTSPVVLDGVSGQELRRVRAVLGCTRINLNVRQVFPNAGDGTPSD